MFDAVVYSDNVPALVDELRKVKPSWVVEDEYGDWVINVDRTPPITNASGTIWLQRLDGPKDLEGLVNLKRIGVYSGDRFIPTGLNGQHLYDTTYIRGPNAPARIGAFA